MLAEARKNLAEYGHARHHRRGRPAAAAPRRPSRSTPCSPPRRSTGSPTTTRSFRNLFAVMRPGGRLAVQCGGAGNGANVVAVLTRTGDGWPGPWNFATPGRPKPAWRRLVSSTSHAWLHPEPAHFDGPRRVRDLPAHGGPRRAPRPPAARRTRRVRRRRRRPAPRAHRRLRPPQLRRPPPRLTGSPNDSVRKAVPNRAENGSNLRLSG